MIVLTFEEGGSDWNGVFISDTIDHFAHFELHLNGITVCTLLCLVKATDICMLIVSECYFTKFSYSFSTNPFGFSRYKILSANSFNLSFQFTCLFSFFQFHLTKSPNTKLSSRGDGGLCSWIWLESLLLRCWLWADIMPMNYSSIST